MATAVVSVHVLDRNEFPPVLRRRRFAGRVSEATAAGALVTDAAAALGTPLVLEADDRDSPANRQRAYEIVEPSAAARFRIDPTTGALRLAAQLDYEEAASHEFTVKVHLHRGRHGSRRSPLARILSKDFCYRWSTWARRVSRPRVQRA